MNTRAYLTKHACQDPRWAKILVIGAVFAFLALFLVLPLVTVFFEAFRRGVEVFWAAIVEPAALHAIKLTLWAAFFCLVFNTLFGLCAAWAITKYDFRGKSVLISFIDVPFSISPVIAGLMLVLLYSVHGFFPPDTIGKGAQWLLQYQSYYPGFVASWLQGLTDFEYKIIFALPGIVLATIFVTFPFVARELIPLMQSQGRDEEISAVMLGANGWQIFWRVTLPNIKWGLFYGMIQCNARAMGEFGAVSVVSGHIRGKTNTMPLHIEILYNEYQFAAAFAISSLLALLAVVTIVAKSVAETKLEHHQPTVPEGTVP